MWQRRRKGESKEARNYSQVCGLHAERRQRIQFDLLLDLRGTDFQRQVWGELQKIPFGDQRSYREIAMAVGRPKAVRAVGSANGSNPVSLVVPCHRVINSDGKLGGYGGGLPLKARLLAMESGAGGDCLL